MAQYRLDWQAGDEDTPMWVKPGRYLAEVERVEEGTSRAGDPLLRLHLREARGAKRTVCRDTVMLAGKGWSIGKRKLHALQIDETTEVLKPSLLIGRLVWVNVVEREYDNKRFNEVDIDASRWAGYEPEEPESLTEAEIEGKANVPPDSGLEVDDTPF